MKKILFALILSFSCAASYADTVSLTKEQYNEIGKIDKRLKEKYPQFQGFSGSRENLEILGLPNAAVQDEISKMNFLDEKKKDIEIEKELKAVKKKMVELAILEAEKDKPLSHKEEVKKILGGE